MQMPMIGVHRASYVVLRGARMIFPITGGGGGGNASTILLFATKATEPTFLLGFATSSAVIKTEKIESFQTVFVAQLRVA